jgi:hypothetical protein
LDLTKLLLQIEVQTKDINEEIWGKFGRIPYVEEDSPQGETNIGKWAKLYRVVVIMIVENFNVK